MILETSASVDDSFYRDRWSHDRIVPSTHGVNCTGSCRWLVYVKDGIITWETQDTDYPSAGVDRPAYEPRGCPRGASFSWYEYSPNRVRYPLVRGVLLDEFRRARQHHGDPVLAWRAVVRDPAVRRRYQQARGKGGFVRASWEEVVDLVSAAYVDTIGRYGPDRIAGFSPIPAMSMVSHAIGARFHALLGAPMLSFYDWYADLPVASPQVFGDQTDVPESADWWDAAYLLLWGSNVPVTRTPDAHFLTEARYRGQKVVVVSPDYADSTKFADEWLAAAPGTDGALAVAMGHVILREFFVESTHRFFTDYVRRYTDLPFLISLRECDGRLVAGKFRTAADTASDDPDGAWKPVFFDESGQAVVVPNGSLGFRWQDTEPGRWNLDLKGRTPMLGLAGHHAREWASVSLPRFDAAAGAGTVFEARVPVVRLADGQPVTTVFDLLLAQYGVARESGERGYADAERMGTPAWQEGITGIPAARAIRIAREFADTALRSEGRCMIVMGAGTNHWFHSDQTYRTFLTLLLLTGCQGRNGGGWAHYVGQEKVRPLTGWSSLSGAADWCRPSRQGIGTGFFYTHTGQWRYDTVTADTLRWPGGPGTLAGASSIDCLARAVRHGWVPGQPGFDRNPLDLADHAAGSGRSVEDYVTAELAAGRLSFASADPDAEENWPRILTVWRSNLIGSSAKGNEYFLHHLLGTGAPPQNPELDADRRPREVRWHAEAASGKLDLLLSLDFRMTSTTLHSDVVLPAATWYEKHDLSSTDMHPFVHSFNAAVAPPWQARTDFDAFHAIAKRFSRLAGEYLGTRRDVVATPLGHDSPDELAQPGGTEPLAGTGRPGRTLPHLTVVERDYPAVAAKLATIGPLLDKRGVTAKGWTVEVTEELHWLGQANGTAPAGEDGMRPRIDTDRRFADAILALSGTTNGRIAQAGFAKLEQQTGRALTGLTEHGHRVTFADTRSRPATVVTSPEWSGDESGGRRYAPFTINVEQLKPWHTLTGRQHFFLDHDWMSELGENLPVYRPPLALAALDGHPEPGTCHGNAVVVRYITPHSKWSIHSTYQDNLHMLTLSRGGPTVWLSPADASGIGVADNEWVELVNRNGIAVMRAIVSHRMPRGTAFVYHVQERTVNTPRADSSGRRGGIHNALTRLLLKPTHLIGGYAQQSFAANYHGPTGNQRDEIAMIRRHSQEVDY